MRKADSKQNNLHIDMATKKAQKVVTPIDQRETFVSIQKNFAESSISIEDQLRTLYALQQADTKIDKIMQLRGELPLEVEALEQEVAEINAKIEKNETEIAEFTSSIAANKNNAAESAHPSSPSTESISTTSPTAVSTTPSRRRSRTRTCCSRLQRSA